MTAFEKITFSPQGYDKKVNYKVALLLETYHIYIRQKYLFQIMTPSPIFKDTLDVFSGKIKLIVMVSYHLIQFHRIKAVKIVLYN